MEELERIELMFDSLLFQISKGLTHEKLEQGYRWDSFQQVGQWKLRFGFKFNVYSNDHLIDGKPHFHFDHPGDGIFCKVDFDGNVLESKGGKSVPDKVLKELDYFLYKQGGKVLLNDLWVRLNPTLGPACR
ncbi:hypothetical protein [Flaviaesturariibacter amylovorans]|uniref:DUF4304 domain-containing protein n=1 Tax=Flaviaesturariibacter amylovorans TaxID=1084520 RepID=A0ABP8H4H9_9BACT